jgi:branched-subunit amino acid transport protein
MKLVLVIIGMGIITYGIRLSLILLTERVKNPEPVRRALRYVPIAVLSAIIFPAMLRPEGPLDLSPGNPYLIAGLIAIGVAWCSRNVVLTMVIGMIVLWSMQALL